MKRVILWFVCLAIMPPVAQAGEMYRWVDKAGKVHYSDTPPPDVQDVERRKLGATSQTDDLPYEARLAQEKFPVTLYVAGGCGAPCNQGRSLLNKRGIPFSEKSLNTQQEIDEFYKKSGSTDAPTLEVGKNYLSGFHESRWNSELDAAGYPKTSFRPRVAPPAAPSAPATPPATESENAPVEPPAQ